VLPAADPVWLATLPVVDEPLDDPDAEEETELVAEAVG